MSTQDTGSRLIIIFSLFLTAISVLFPPALLGGGTEGVLPLTGKAAMVGSASIAAPALNVETITVPPAATLDIPILFTPGSTAVSALEFDLALPSPLNYTSTTTGDAASAAGKTAAAAFNNGKLTVLVYGLNQNAIGPGPIARVGLKISASSLPSTLPVGISNVIASDPLGKAVAVSATSGFVLVRAPSDFDSDGKPDILWRNSATGQNVVWLMDGTTLSTEVNLRTISDVNWTIVGTGDFNGDGKIDLVWRNYQNGLNAVWLMDGTTLIQGVYLRSIPDLNWRIVGVGDFNGDGKPDLLWRNYQNGLDAVWLMDGTTLIQGVYLRSIPDLNWRIVGVGDFNGDGQPDLLWRNYQNGLDAVWLMDGTTLIQGVYLRSIPDLNWRIVGVGDFNGDGKPDLLWRNYQNGLDAVWLMDGTNLIQGVYLTTVSDLNWKIGDGF